MAIAIVLVIALATLILLKYLESLDIYKRDKRTNRMMVVGVAVGAISAPVSLLIYEINPFFWVAGSLGPLGYNVLVVGLSEEIGKYGCFIAMVLIARSIKEPQDGIIQGAAVGLVIIPAQNCRAFRRNAAIDSAGNLPPVPVESCHRFRAKLAGLAGIPESVAGFTGIRG